MNITKLTAQPTSFNAVAALSRALCKTNEAQLAEFQPQLVYVANHALTKRVVELVPGAEATHVVRNTTVTGLWEGFEKNNIVRVLWTSHSSGATLLLHRFDGYWWLQYEGPEGDRESQYLKLWFKAVNPQTVDVLGMNAEPLVLDMLRQTEGVDYNAFMKALETVEVE